MVQLEIAVPHEILKHCQSAPFSATESYSGNASSPDKPVGAVSALRLSDCTGNGSRRFCSR